MAYSSLTFEVFAIGDIVEVRNHDLKWKKGKVISSNPPLLYVIADSKDFHSNYDEVRHINVIYLY